MSVNLFRQANFEQDPQEASLQIISETCKPIYFIFGMNIETKIINNNNNLYSIIATK